MVVEVTAAAVNKIDVEVALGDHPRDTKWPRTPGRDFAGVVVDGPEKLVGLEVWGSSGDLGIRVDGSHGTHLVIPISCVRTKPRALSLLEAGSVGVPFVTAWKGFERAGFPGPDDVVLVLGASGKVGQAAIQIATMCGSRTIGIVRNEGSFKGHYCRPIEILSGSTSSVTSHVRDVTAGHGADIVFNTVGSPYFQLAHRTLAVRGRQILIATTEKTVPFGVFEFSNAQHTYVGVDTLALNTEETISILDELRPGFESGDLRPFPIPSSSVYDLIDAASAYARVMNSTKDRIVLAPNGKQSSVRSSAGL